MKLNRNILLGGMLGIALCAGVSSANALAIGDVDYLGSITDGIPSNPTAEAGYINNLITLAAGAADTQIPAGTGEIYNRQGSTLAGPFPTAVTSGSAKEEDGTTPGFDNTIDATGFAYVVAKYDAAQAGSLVWYLGAGDGEVTVPTEFNGKGLSHISLYNPGGNGVPDGGTTTLLLGLAMLGLEGLRRRFVK